MSWEVFHYALATWVFIYAVKDGVPKLGRQYFFGAEIHLAALIASDLARWRAGDSYPVIWYAGIDMIAVSLFALIMLRKKALWAGVCVLLHSAMLLLHPIFFLGGETNQKEFLWAVGTLTFLVALTINSGTAAGRHDFGRRWDQYLVPRLRGWSFSGAISARLAAYEETVE